MAGDEILEDKGGIFLCKTKLKKCLCQDNFGDKFGMFAYPQGLFTICLLDSNTTKSQMIVFLFLMVFVYCTLHHVPYAKRLTTLL